MLFLLGLTTGFLIGAVTVIGVIHYFMEKNNINFELKYEKK